MNPTTNDMVRSAASGDRASFETLVRQNAAMVTGVAYSYCGDFALSEDIAQTAFLEAWKNLSTIREPEKFPGWIAAIARRRAIDAVRRNQSQRIESSLDSASFEFHDPKQSSAAVRYEDQQERELVWSMLAKLPKGYREPMILYYRCGESTRDVALALGESDANIRQRLKRGRELLRGEMDRVLRGTITATAPTTAFAAAVMAALPSSAYGANAAGTAAPIASGGMIGNVSTAAGAATLGPLLGVAGGIAGAWMSWRNCAYVSQQIFILQRAKLYLQIFFTFGALVAALIAARFVGWFPNETAYGTLLVTSIVAFQVFNVAWIWRTIAGYARVTQMAQQCGEAMRDSIQRRNRGATEESSSTDAQANFRWNAGSWFGSWLGSIAWMVPLSFIAIRYGSLWLGMIAVACFVVAIAATIITWRMRDHIDAYAANQCAIAFLFLMATTLLVAMQSLANVRTLTALGWTSYSWTVLLIFPLVSIQFWWLRRNAGR